ncbi:MAG: hypothetical protein ACPLZD_07535 [Candidatus Saccharicenans sp.]
MPKKTRSISQGEKIAFFSIFSIIIFWLWASATESIPSPQWINISISPGAINFPAADPDAQPLIQADNQVALSISLPQRRRWVLYIRAEGDLTSSQGTTIPISNLSWAASPQPPLKDGVLVARQNLQLGAGQGRLYNGLLTFYFKNSWNYVAGTYAQIITFTVTQI